MEYAVMNFTDSIMSMPNIAIDGLPIAEQDAARSVRQCLVQLHISADEFKAAVLLYQEFSPARFSERQPRPMSQWATFGGRIGALCLYDFLQATHEINRKLLHRCPTIMNMIDMEAKGAAQRLLDKSFPDLVAVRTGAAHTSTLHATPEKAEKNKASANGFGPSIRGEGKLLMTSGMIDGRYTHTLDGKAVSYACDLNSVQILYDVLKLWDDAFAPVEKGTYMLRDKAEAEVELGKVVPFPTANS